MTKTTAEWRNYLCKIVIQTWERWLWLSTILTKLHIILVGVFGISSNRALQTGCCLNGLMRDWPKTQRMSSIKNHIHQIWSQEDFSLIPKLNLSLHGRQFQSIESVREKKERLKSMLEKAFKKCAGDWVNCYLMYPSSIYHSIAKKYMIRINRRHLKMKTPAPTNFHWLPSTIFQFGSIAIDRENKNARNSSIWFNFTMNN